MHRLRTLDETARFLDATTGPGMFLFAVAVGLLVAGCFRPQLQDGDVTCGPRAECPPGFLCEPTTGKCLRDPSGPNPIDASVGDEDAPVDVIDGAPGDPLANRVPNPMVVYLFDEGEGIEVRDQSGRPEPLNLAISDLGQVAWDRQNGTLAVIGEVNIVPPGLNPNVPSTRIRTELQASNAISLEAWVTPAEAEATGPRRIIAFSGSPSAQNFVLAHGGPSTSVSRTSFALRLYTSAITNPRGTPQLNSPPGTAEAGKTTHVVYTRDADGNIACYIDGQAVDTSRYDGTAMADVPVTVRDGDFAVWDLAHIFGVGNEINPPPEELGLRNFVGALHLIAVYSKALSQDEVLTNFAAGADPEIR